MENTLAHSMTTRQRVFSVLRYLAIAFIFLFLLFPIYWMVITSFKPNAENYRVIPTFWPKTFSTDGYRTLFTDGIFFGYYFNNFITSAEAAALILFISVFTGYAISRIHLSWNKWLVATFTVSQMFPVISRLISLYGILGSIHLTDTRLGLVFAIAATQVPFCVTLMASFFDSIPLDIEEAANIDGAGRLGTLFKIVVPLVLPGLLAVGIYSFLQTWDDYLHAITLIRSESLWTLSQGLKLRYLGEVSDWQLINAASTLGTVPMVLVFFFFQKYMIQGLTAGAVKG